jgi:hypothetical protein
VAFEFAVGLVGRELSGTLQIQRLHTTISFLHRLLTVSLLSVVPKDIIMPLIANAALYKTDGCGPRFLTALFVTTTAQLP